VGRDRAADSDPGVARADHGAATRPVVDGSVLSMNTAAVRSRGVDEKPEDEDFAAFYEQARADCLRAVYAAVGEWSLAEDATAEAFARAYASLTGNGTVVNVDNAAFSVHTDVKTGKVAVTIRQYGDEGELKQILAKAGIRTVFISATVPESAHDLRFPLWSCTWLGAKPLSASSVVQQPTPVAPDTFTIDPSKMPSGSVLAFQFEDLTLANATPDGVVVSRQLLSAEPTGCTTK